MLGKKSLRIPGPKIWNSLPEDVKDLTSPPKFTEFIKTWYGPKCKCKIYNSTNTRVTQIIILEPQIQAEYALLENS